MLSIWKDIRSGMLPIRELPKFIIWLLGKTFWPMFGLIVIGVLILVLK